MPLYNIFKENKSIIFQGGVDQTSGGNFANWQLENKLILAIAVFVFA
jgi:hypothetical protein